MNLHNFSGLTLCAALIATAQAELSLKEQVNDRNGYPCVNYKFLPVPYMPAECVHHNICVEEVANNSCTYDKSKKYDTLESLKGIGPYCVKQIICKRTSKRAMDHLKNHGGPMLPMRDKDPGVDYSRVVSIKYPTGHVSRLVDYEFFYGVICRLFDGNLSDIYHECLYKRVCEGASFPPTECPSDPAYYNRIIYDRHEIDAHPACAYRMLCNRDEHPEIQSQEDKDREQPRVRYRSLCRDAENSLRSLPEECTFKKAIDLGRPNKWYLFKYFNKTLPCSAWNSSYDKIPKECILGYTAKLDVRNAHFGHSNLS